MPREPIQAFRRVGFVKQAEFFLDQHAGILADGGSDSFSQVVGILLWIYGHPAAAVQVMSGGPLGLYTAYTWSQQYEPGTKILDDSEKRALIGDLEMRERILDLLMRQKGLRLEFDHAEGASLQRFVFTVKGSIAGLEKNQELALQDSDLRVKVEAY